MTTLDTRTATQTAADKLGEIVEQLEATYEALQAANVTPWLSSWVSSVRDNGTALLRASDSLTLELPDGNDAGYWASASPWGDRDNPGGYYVDAVAVGYLHRNGKRIFTSYRLRLQVPTRESVPVTGHAWADTHSVTLPPAASKLIAARLMTPLPDAILQADRWQIISEATGYTAAQDLIEKTFKASQALRA